MASPPPAILGKQVGLHTYWHDTLTASQPAAIQHLVETAALLAGLTAGQDFNVIKLANPADSCSLLHYPDFFENPFPALSVSWTVNLTTQAVTRRSYATALNPPILHRKELFLPADHPRLAEYQALTRQAEQLGLFEHSRTIGFKRAWDALIAARGYRLEGHQLLPLLPVANAALSAAEVELNVLRHRTALTRYNLSAPIQALARFGLLDQQKSVFDYGCGKGDDVRNLQANQIEAAGWDPYFAPDATKKTADIVNLGFVINVIEDLKERVAAVQNAFALAQELLVVSAMLYNQNAFSGQRYQDGVLTQRNTFQKYYTQSELKAFLDTVLAVDSIAIAPGIFFVFQDSAAEQRFLLGRQQSRANLLRLTQRPLPQASPSRREQRDQARLVAAELSAQARQNRINDLLVYFALYAFSRRKPYRTLETALQLDIKAFFGQYSQALEQGRALLFRLADTPAIEADCSAAAAQGIGHYDDAQALYLPSEQVERLSPLLRVYIGCAALLYGDISQADLIKIHTASGKLSLMHYDDFSGNALPRLLERVKINFKTQDFAYFGYGGRYEPPYLYLKSRYLNANSPQYAAQVAFDEHLQQLGLFELAGYGPDPAEFRQKLAAARWEVAGMQLIRSRRIPELDEPCGQYFTYRDFIECGETWHKTQIPNRPQQADSYTALYDLVTQILEPVIDYFGMIHLTYGFCSSALAKAIPCGIAPKRDQHAGCELNRLGNPVCPRLGAAVDFIVEDEDMREVATWIAQHTPFDRLCFYGVDQPLHVSYSNSQYGKNGLN